MNDTFNGIEIKKMMKAKKISVKDMAKKIGIHPNSLSSALNGNRGLGKSALLLLFKELCAVEALKDKAS